jgi:DNA-binding transcriptional MerR regulator
MVKDNDESLSRGEPAWSDDELTICAASDDGATLTIGELAREFGITLRALRFYEGKGLLFPQRQGASRLYGQSDRVRLGLILKAKKLGFTLAETCRMINTGTEPADGGELSISRRQCFDQIKHLEGRKREIEAALAVLRRTYSSFYARLANVAR